MKKFFAVLCACVLVSACKVTVPVADTAPPPSAPPVIRVEPVVVTPEVDLGALPLAPSAAPSVAASLPAVVSATPSLPTPASK